MKKLGILSLYYNNRNYGGLLQAYALCRCISEMGYDCEQICRTDKIVNSINKRCFKINYIPIYIKRLLCFFLVRICRYKSLIEERNNAMAEFQNKISHSQEIYNKDNIKDCVCCYDAFITGSDQVWNLDWYKKEYFLDFVPENISKFSYAASMPNVDITEEQKSIVKKHLESFDAISVREKETAMFLKELTGKDVMQTLDPTLLLDRYQWDDICSAKLVDGDYIFCYFLGKEKIMRVIARGFAKKIKCKIVALPHLADFCRNDLFYSNINLYNISPQQFISLIKYAKYVITDSFHASVFSTIYKTKYFVFDRTDVGIMSSRITSLLSLTKNEYRFCCGDKMSLNYMIKIKDKPVDDFSTRFVKAKNDSIKFLKDILEKTNRK